MKWTQKQIDTLRKLCNEGKPNAEIAKVLKCDVKDIHAKRSQLGITIPKVKAAQITQKVDKTTKKVDPLKDVEKAFGFLHETLLAVSTTDAQVQTCSEMAAAVLSLENIFFRAIRMEG